MTNAELIAWQNRVQSPVERALRRAFSLGQTYWQQADSESYAQNRRSDETHAKFEALVAEMIAEPTHQGAASLSGAQQKQFDIAIEALTYIGNFVCDAGDGDDWHLKDHASHALELIALVSAAPAQPAPGGEDRRSWERVANEWADLAKNGPNILRDVRDGHLSFQQAEAQMRASFERVRAMSPPPTSPTSRPFTEAEHAAWERENGVGEAAKGEGERG